jgi:hypothetical protein
MADERLRADLLHAFKTARRVYDDLSRGDTAPFTLATRVATDDEIRERLRGAIEDLRSANERLQGRRSDSHAGRNATLLVAGIALGILFNPVSGPETRRFLRDMLFGGDELPSVDSYDGRE